MQIINLTPHDIKLNNGTVFPASGFLLRVEMNQIELSRTDFPYQTVRNVPGDLVIQSKDGNAQMNFSMDDNTFFIVSAMVLDAIRNKEDWSNENNPFRNLKKTQFIAPNTSSPDVIRNDKGHILSVPGFVQL